MILLITLQWGLVMDVCLDVLFQKVAHVNTLIFASTEEYVEGTCDVAKGSQSFVPRHRR